MAPDRLLIFCKAPIAGEVKTRLVPTLSPESAAAFYDASLRDVVALSGRERARVELWCDRDESTSMIADSYPHLVTATQLTGSLGDRQRDAFDRTFSDGAERVVIIGSDSPTMPEAVLNAAFDDLRECAGVIGPAHDGGYYLIGLHSTAWPRAADIFDEIEWSTPGVLSEILYRAQTLGVELRVLPGWYDVDVPEDLELLRADVAPQSHVAEWFRTITPDAATQNSADRPIRAW